MALLILSTVLVAFYLYGRPYILYNDSDPLTYFRKAWWYLGRAGGADIPSRGPGYPIWLILTGAASFDIWWGLMASQVAMAIAAPVLAYGILAPYSRNAGFVAGLLFMLFAISYQHMNWVMTEGLFLFVELVSFLMISRYFAGAWAPVPSLRPGASRRSRLWHRFLVWLRTPYPIALLLSYCTMVKAAGSPFFWLFLGVCVLFRVEPWKRYVGPAALYVAIMMAWGTHHYLFSPVRFSPLGMPAANQAQRNFADVYYGSGYGAVNGWAPAGTAARSADGPRKVDPPTIRPEDGPASKRLYEVVAKRIASERKLGKWNVDRPESAYQLYGRYETDAELLNAIFLRPNPFYFSLVHQAALAADGDRLMRDVAREHGNAGLRAFLNYLWRHPTLPLKGPGNSYVGYHFFSKFYRQQQFFDAGYYGPRDLYLARPLTRITFIREENGKASRAFADSIRFFVAAFPQYLGIGPNELREFGSTDELATAIIAQRGNKYDGSIMGWVFEWLVVIHGEERMGDLLGAAGVEATLRNPSSPSFLLGDFLAGAVYADNGGYEALRGHMGIDFIHHAGKSFASVRAAQGANLMNTVKSGVTTLLPPRLAAWVGEFHEPTELSKDIETVLVSQYGLFKWSKPILFALMMMFMLPVIILRVGERLMVFLLLAFFVSAAAWVVAMVPPDSDPRHENVFAFIPILVAMLGFATLPQLLRTIELQAGTLRAESAPRR